MEDKHDLSEQMYLAFHDWRARLDHQLDRLRTDYLHPLHADLQRTLVHIEHELASRQQAEQRVTVDTSVLATQNQTKAAYHAHISEDGEME